MPQVESHIEISAPLDEVWKLAQDVENYPRIMPDLEDVKVASREEQGGGNTRVVSEWKGRIKQLNRNINWTEEDIWNVNDHSCHFWQLRGDFSEYGGDYLFVQDGDKTRIDLQVNYRFDIPLLGALMQKVIQKLMQDNADNMLSALKSEAEKRVDNTESS